MDTQLADFKRDCGAVSQQDNLDAFQGSEGVELGEQKGTLYEIIIVLGVICIVELLVLIGVLCRSRIRKNARQQETDEGVYTVV